MPLHPTAAAKLHAAAVPAELHKRFDGAGGVVLGLTVDQWLEIARRRGPVTWFILWDLLNSHNGQPLPPLPPPAEGSADAP